MAFLSRKINPDVFYGRIFSEKGSTFRDAPQEHPGLLGGQPKLLACRICLTQNRFTLLLEMLYFSSAQ